jgi:hypothetical protein
MKQHTFENWRQKSNRELHSIHWGLKKNSNPCCRKNAILVLSIIFFFERETHTSPDTHGCHFTALRFFNQSVDLGLQSPSLWASGSALWAETTAQSPGEAVSLCFLMTISPTVEKLCSLKVLSPLLGAASSVAPKTSFLSWFLIDKPWDDGVCSQFSLILNDSICMCFPLGQGN